MSERFYNITYLWKSGFVQLQTPLPFKLNVKKKNGSQIQEINTEGNYSEEEKRFSG